MNDLKTNDETNDSGREVAWAMIAIMIVIAILSSEKAISFLLGFTEDNPRGNLASFGASTFILGLYLGLWLRRRIDLCKAAREAGK